MEKARFQELYEKEIRSKLKKELGLDNIMAVPKIAKIVVNVGVKDAVADSKVLQNVMQVIADITGQKPVRTSARHSVAGFKIREGMPIGVKVTLRKRRMYEFLDRLVTLSLPKVRDFQGIPAKLDGRGNYNLGVKEWGIFPEVSYESSEKSYGMNITIHTTAQNDEHGLALLKSFSLPFRKA